MECPTGGAGDRVIRARTESTAFKSVVRRSGIKILFMLNCRYKTTGADRFLYSCLFAVMIFSITGCDSSDIANEESSDFRTWSDYLGDKGGTQYSSLDQITTENVDKLQIAWIFSTGDTISGVRTEIQANPIIVGDTLYATTEVICLKNSYR